MTDKSLAWPGTDWEVPGMAGAMTAVLWRLIRRKWGLVCLQYPGMARHVLVIHRHGRNNANCSLEAYWKKMGPSVPTVPWHGQACTTW